MCNAGPIFLPPAIMQGKQHGSKAPELIAAASRSLACNCMQPGSRRHGKMLRSEKIAALQCNAAAQRRYVSWLSAWTSHEISSRNPAWFIFQTRQAIVDDPSCLLLAAGV